MIKGSTLTILVIDTQPLIVNELGITENTVKLYVSQALRLTRMHNRTQLALALLPNNAQHCVTAH